MLIEGKTIRTTRIASYITDLLELKRLLALCTDSTGFIDEVVSHIKHRFSQTVQMLFTNAASSVELQTSGGRVLEAEVVKQLRQVTEVIEGAASFVSDDKFDSETPDSGKVFLLVQDACKREFDHIKRELEKCDIDTETITTGLNNIEALATLPGFAVSSCNGSEFTPHTHAVQLITDVGTAVATRYDNLVSGGGQSEDVTDIMLDLDRSRALQNIPAAADVVTAANIKVVRKLNTMFKGRAGEVRLWLTEVTTSLPPLEIVSLAGQSNAQEHAETAD
jgi:hypothetical protein